MIVSAIADPSVFGPASVIDELVSRELIGFLRGIVQNGVLLCDPTRQMIRDALSEVNQLLTQPGGTRRGQRISILLQEIDKQHKKYIVCCEEATWNAANPAGVSDQIRVLHSQLHADVVVAPRSLHAAFNQTLVPSVELSTPQDISVSQYEALRIQISSPNKPLDAMTRTEVEEYIGRAVKYCCVLRLYDYRMVARIRSINKYSDGIKFVLLIWAKWCVVGTSTSRMAELYTVGNTHTQDGFVTGTEAKSRLASQIVAAVMATCRCRSIGYVVEDGKGIFHARGFEANTRTFTIDPGFDALGPNGPVRRCLLKADTAAEQHFDQCRSLKLC